MVCQAERIGPNAFVALLLRQSAVRWQPKNSLKLTRPAGPLVLRVLPVGERDNQGECVRFRRAA
jgi:hypothetical protein